MKKIMKVFSFYVGHPTSTETPSFTTNTPPMTTANCDHGWTVPMNGDNPNNGDGGDYETISALQQKYQFCSKSMISDIRCVIGGTQQEYDQVGQKVTCDRNEGLICNNADQTDGQCQDYAVLFFCDCKECKSN